LPRLDECGHPFTLDERAPFSVGGAALFALGGGLKSRMHADQRGTRHELPVADREPERDARAERVADQVNRGQGMLHERRRQTVDLAFETLRGRRLVVLLRIVPDQSRREHAHAQRALLDQRLKIARATREPVQENQRGHLGGLSGPEFPSRACRRSVMASSSAVVLRPLTRTSITRVPVAWRRSAARSSVSVLTCVCWMP